MRVSRPKISLLVSLLLTLFSITITARAVDDEPDDYEVKARVVRVSLISGEATLKRNGNKDWEQIRLNYPLVEGDTVATGKDSRLEIQVDSRNFVRLAASSALRIVTLREEGVAMSVIEGTATVRLAKFDHDRGEYFEIDAPKTTLAAEKKGLYRIDVSVDGRVRLTVRDGGQARIYSDTSGFTLRDGRSAELVVTGDNAGDWDLFAAAPRDGVDDWVNEREQYLAQRLKYDVKYFDEYVWGAEDLDAYGDWIRTDDYGWIWRPRAGTIAGYSDWAPYRYGNWEWCPPYGWTWIGYEPWGWAPYHYGRWVYYNNYWAWCPRSRFYRNRSWWRPALVAFVSLDFSFGNDICWYPLSYYQRDPHSRHYGHDDRRPGYGPPRDGQNDRYGHDKMWRGVTRVPRTDFGNGERRGQPVDETIARRVVDSPPELGDLPRKSGSIRLPVIHIPDRPTGAAEREPGAALDEDLRRSRVFRGRDPRPVQPPSEPRRSETNTSTNTSEPQPQPTGAVSRPEPAAARESRPEDRPGRMVRPVTSPEGSEGFGKRGRSQQAIESEPRNAPEPRREQPAPVTQPEAAPPPRETPRVDRHEKDTPRYEPRPEPRTEPRSESPRTEPRSEPRSAPSRSESPRSESPRSESPRSESPRSESPRSESPRSESPRSESPRSESPRSESPRSESPRSESPRTESPKKPDNPNR